MFGSFSHRAPQQHTKLYEVMGLSPEVEASEIKKTYYRLAKQYHPDKNPNLSPDQANKFKDISHAYEILSDPEKRQIYDQGGEEAVDGMGMRAGMGMESHPMADMFGGGQNRKPIKQVVYNLKLSSYFTKTKVEFVIDREHQCTDCDSTGFADKIHRSCKKCNGQGFTVKMARNGPFMQQVPVMCPSCNGSKMDTANSKKNDVCRVCSGSCSVTLPEKIEADIPSDIHDRPLTVIPEKGSWTGSVYEDLAVIFKLILPKNYNLANDKRLVYTMTINYPETLCGFRRLIKHPSGRDILIVADPGTVIDPNKIYQLEGCGFSRDLMYLMFLINYPTSPLTLPNTNNLSLNWEAVSQTMGSKLEDDYDESKTDVQTYNTFNITDLQFVDNSQRRRESINNENSEEREGLEEEEEDTDRHHHHSHPRGQSVNCATQ